jgi:hypothetical protein
MIIFTDTFNIININPSIRGNLNKPEAAKPTMVLHKNLFPPHSYCSIRFRIQQLISFGSL